MATSWICMPLLFGSPGEVSARVDMWRRHPVLGWWDVGFVGADEWRQQTPTSEQRDRLNAALDQRLFDSSEPLDRLVHRIAVAWALEALATREKYWKVEPGKTEQWTIRREPSEAQTPAPR